MTARTIRDESRAYLDRAVERGAITSGELLRVLDFWNERDSLDQNPYAVFRDGYFEREERVNEIIKRAYA